MKTKPLWAGAWLVSITVATLAGYFFEHGVSRAHGHQDPATADWSYTGASGPIHWAELSADYHLCADGRRQSPIDLNSRREFVDLRRAFNYGTVVGERALDTHTVRFNVRSGATFTAPDGRLFALKQLHYHDPAEHTVDGRQHDAELHLVHQSASGEVAVVAVLFDLRKNMSATPAVPLPMTSISADNEHLSIDLAALLPADRSAWTYEGSLTTPPCTEGVSWFVLRALEPITHAQLSTLSQAVAHNNRPCQR